MDQERPEYAVEDYSLEGGVLSGLVQIVALAQQLVRIVALAQQLVRRTCETCQLTCGSFRLL